MANLKKNLQLFRSSALSANRADAIAVMKNAVANLTAAKYDGMPIVGRYGASDAEAKSVLGIIRANGTTSKLTIIGDDNHTGGTYISVNQETGKIDVNSTYAETWNKVDNKVDSTTLTSGWLVKNVTDVNSNGLHISRNGNNVTGSMDVAGENLGTIKSSSTATIVNGQITEIPALANKQNAADVKVLDIATGSNNGVNVSISGKKATIKGVVATNTTYGVVKSGGDVTVGSDGIMSVGDNSHKHTITNITNLTTELDGKAPIKHNHEISDINELSNTLSQMDAKISGAFHFKGTKNTIAELEAVSQKSEGDVYQVLYKDAAAQQAKKPLNAEYAYDGSKWVELGSILDLSAYKVKSITPGTGISATTQDGIATISNTGVLNINANSYGLTANKNTGNVTLSMSKASTGGFGTVKIGSNINVSAGVISVNTGSKNDAGVVKYDDVTIKKNSSEQLYVDNNSHNHTIANITGLQDKLTALDSKADGKVDSVTGTYPIKVTGDKTVTVSLLYDNITLVKDASNNLKVGEIAQTQVKNLVDTLSGKAAAVHKHEVGDINGLDSHIKSFINYPVKSVDEGTTPNGIVVDPTTGDVKISANQTSKNGFGTVKVGDNIDVTSGTISVAFDMGTF